MNALLWSLQVLGALVYVASGTMKVFMFERIRGQDPSFEKLPKAVWTALGTIELLCAVGLIVPGLLHRQQSLTELAAAILALESLVFIWAHAQARQLPPIVMSAVLGLLMAFLAYGRVALVPLH
jgi:uncharacterized membrane protein YphA (DoxX/SURF4 family)